MKILFIVLFLSTISVNANTFSQESVVLNVKNMTIKNVFAEIERVSEYRFLFKGSLGNSLDKKISIDIDYESINEALELAIKDTDLKYNIIDKQVIVYKSDDKPTVTTHVADQQRGNPLVIKGKVKDNRNESLIGVTVLVKGTQIGTTTDLDGNYEINIPLLDGVDDAVLVFTYIGFKRKEVVVSESKTLPIVLEEDVSEIGEVVVTGYYERNKESFTGNVVSVGGEELMKVSNSNLLGALQIFDPSFISYDNINLGSNPNSLPNLRIRGNSGLGTDVELSRASLKNDPNLPTFILDGYEVSVEKIFDLNMERIENITILKDASATAIYGSRAANGVIVVTTKTPKPGRLTVSYTGDMSVVMPDLSDYRLLNATEKLEVEKRAGMYEHDELNVQQMLSMDYSLRQRNIAEGINTYWLAQPLQSAIGQKHSLYIEGGDEQIRYGVDANYHNSPGVMKVSKRERSRLGFLLSYNLNNKLLFRNVISVENINSKESPYGSFRSYAEANPYYSPYTKNGNLQNVYETYMNYTQPIHNPLYEASLNNKNQTDYIEITNNFDLDWFISENFRLKGRVAFSERRDNSKQFTDPRSGLYSGSYYQFGEGILKKGRAYVFDERSNTIDANLVVSYNKQVKKHFLNAALGANVLENNFSNEGYSVIGFPTSDLDYISFGKEFENNTPNGREGVMRLLGAFLNANYSFNNVYLIDVSGRLDGSSQFGSNKRIAPFWSVGAGWNIHNAGFFDKNEVINHLKLTANVGSLGKASFEPYQARTMYEYYQGKWYGGGVGAVMVDMGNEDLSWEKTYSYDLSLEAQFLQNRISANLTYYYKDTKDLLAMITLPLSSGFEQYRDNLGQLTNKGFEFTLRGFPIRNQKFALNLYATLATNSNKIKEISNSLQSINDNIDKAQNENIDQAKKIRTQFKEGQSTTAIYAVKSLGINPADGREIYVDRFGEITYEWNSLDKIVCGDTSPKFTGAFGLNGDYGQFSLSANFLYRIGGQIYNSTLVERVENANLRFNVDERVLNSRWQEPGDKAFFKDIRDRSATRITSRFVEDDNSVSMKSLSFSYLFNKNFLKNLGVGSLRVNFMMEDVFRISSVKQERGLDYPFARTFNVGTQIQF